jgi:hypothetical protein
MLYVALASLIVGTIGATRGVWEPRLLGKRQPHREAAARLLAFLRERREEFVMTTHVSTSTDTRELVVTWKQDVTPLQKDLPAGLADRCAVMGELLERAEAMDLRAHLDWLVVCGIAFGDLERAAERTASARGPGPRAFVSRVELLDLLHRGETLRTGLKPLHNAAWDAVRRADGRGRRRDALLLVASSALMGASLTVLVISL